MNLGIRAGKRYTNPMGIWERLENIIKSHLNEGNDRSYRKSPYRRYDPDLENAYEELDDFLSGKNSGEKDRPVPEELRKDFAELGLKPDASMEECREAYKRLLKIHHPDRHAKHEGNMRKATAKTARVNASYERLEKWFTENP